MKMAKPSERDIDAAGNAMSVLIAIDRGDYPKSKGDEDAPDCFDEDDPAHLRRFYDAMKETLDAGPGWPGRVIGGMCYVILFPKNEILDPDSDVLDLHPKFTKQEQQLDAALTLLSDALEAFDQDTSKDLEVADRIRAFLTKETA